MGKQATIGFGEPRHHLTPTLRWVRLSSANARGGFALITAVVVLTLIGVLTTAFVAVCVSASRQTDQHSDAARLRSSGESAMQVAVNELWSGYLVQNGGMSKSMLDLRGFLAGRGIAAAQSVTTAQACDLTSMAKLPQGGSAARGLAGTNVESLRVTRVDGPGTTELRF